MHNFLNMSYICIFCMLPLHHLHKISMPPPIGINAHTVNLIEKENICELCLKMFFIQ